MPLAARATPPASGAHAFDFQFGIWKTELRLRPHPMRGAGVWERFTGTSVIRKVWGGRANLVELEVSGPAGHIEALNLRIYNPQSHQWSLIPADSRSGTLGVPSIGSFHHGRGEFYDMEPIHGRDVLVRQIVTRPGPDSFRFEQAFSADGGKTWHANWIATATRVRAAKPTCGSATSLRSRPPVGRAVAALRSPATDARWRSGRLQVAAT